jgi:5-methylcytosine-specific restriction endonuclease McrA
VPVVGGRIDPAGRPCLAPASTVDHVVSRAKGGNDDPDNLRAACGPHNFGKGARLDAEVAAGVRSPAWNW